MFEEVEGRAVLVAQFTNHLDRHGAALRELVRFPERLRLRQSRFALAELERLRSDVSRRVQAPQVAPSAVSIHGDAIRVALPTGMESLAAELRSLYGDRVEVTLGTVPKLLRQ